MTKPAASAKAAGLRHVTPDGPGLSRRRTGGQFVYLTAGGRRVRDRTTLSRITALVLPPAWRDVWIASDPLAHLQATGRDAAGRIQYRYHASWISVRALTKFDRLLALGRALPVIRARVVSDMRKPAHSRQRVLATVVQLLERTRIRIGNAEYLRANGSHGLTTLNDRHVAIRGGHLHFEFKAKSGIWRSVDLEDAPLARAVRECRAVPGRALFQYVDETGNRRRTTSSDVNGYLHTIAGGAFTAKDFRTWAGTLVAAEALAAAESSERATDRSTNRSIVAAIDVVAHALGNTRAVCRRSYIHPAVIDAFRLGRTLRTIGPLARRTRSGLLASEARLMALLGVRRRIGHHAPGPNRATRQ